MGEKERGYWLYHGRQSSKREWRRQEGERERQTQTHTRMGVSCIFQEVNFKVEETEIVIISFGG